MSDHQREVYDTMGQMGFEEETIEWAWNRADVKTVEGLLNYIENNEQ